MVEYTIINAVTALIGVVFLVNGYKLVKVGREDILQFVASGIVGTGLLIVAAFPGLFDYIAALIGVEIKTNAMLIVATLTLFLLSMYLINRTGRLYEDISRLNEEMSLLRNRVEELDDE